MPHCPEFYEKFKELQAMAREIKGYCQVDAQRSVQRVAKYIEFCEAHDLRPFGLIPEGAIRPLTEQRNQDIAPSVVASLKSAQKKQGFKITNGYVRKLIAEQRHERVGTTHSFDLQLYNVWNFGGCDDKYGTLDYPGRVPGQIVENVLHYFTDEGDTVVDPMAGGGTTPDVCRAMNRVCLAYDLKPAREDIKQHDIKNGFPEEAKGCKLIFLDPPYFNMVFKDLYIDIHDFYSFLRDVADNCHKTIRARARSCWTTYEV